MTSEPKAVWLLFDIRGEVVGCYVDPLQAEDDARAHGLNIYTVRKYEVVPT